MTEHYDLIVVGAGSTGGVIAARASENSATRVLLLDAGPDFPDEANRLPLFAVSGENSWQVPAVPEFDWGFVERDRAGRRHGRPIRLPRGKFVGGTSMVNSTIAARPAPFDLDRWAALGCAGWQWESLLPVFARLETDRDFPESPIHGHDGPIIIQRYKESAWAPVNRVFADACLALGIPYSADLNDLGSHAGVIGALPHNRFKELRLGTLVTYLRTARPRSNLVIRPDSLVDRILFSGSRAVGVTWLAGTRHAEATADRIVVSAGVYNTPAVLQRSGIGPANLLRTHAIPIVADLPVGRALTDHPGAPFLFRAEGIAGTVGRFFAANWRGAAVEGEPWWQTHPFPVDEEEGICGLWTYLCRQHSSGAVEITGTDPRVAPLIDHDYLADAEDTARFADAWQANQALLATAPFRNHNARFLDPIDDLPTYLAANLGSAHHQSGSCRMGVDPTVSVVDPQLRVHGIDGLFVADSSVFPDTVMHNTNLMCYALGEVVGEAIARSQ